VIGGFRGGPGNINHDCGRYETRAWNLVRRQLAFTEMNRRVQVCAAVLARGVSGGRVPVPARGSPPRFLLPLKRFRRRPVDCVLFEAVGQVNDLRFIPNTAQLADRPVRGLSYAFIRSVQSVVERKERESADEQNCDNRQNQFMHGYLLNRDTSTVPRE